MTPSSEDRLADVEVYHDPMNDAYWVNGHRITKLDLYEEESNLGLLSALPPSERLAVAWKRLVTKAINDPR